MDIACVRVRGRGSFWFLAPLAVVLAVAASGCARTAGRAGSYVRDRGLDLVDCFHVGAGCGLGADVRPSVVSHGSLRDIARHWDRSSGNRC